MSSPSHPSSFVRLRRLRRSPAVRGLVRENSVQIDRLIMPLFVTDEAQTTEIPAMPGQERIPLARLEGRVEEMLRVGIQAVALFPVVDPSLKDPAAGEALNPEGLVPRAVRLLRAAFPSLVLVTDIALDPFTDHGHDGLLKADGSDVDNDQTVRRLSQMAVLHAAAGADWVAPSDMMDGRVAAIRGALDREGFPETAILAYSAKFCSAYYGPFRQALGSGCATGSVPIAKGTYQIDPANRRMALRECELDVAEGADIVMVKPAGPCLDIIREVRDRVEVPVAAYQVSGEYAQIHAAARLGWLDLTATRDESLLAIRRAGADIILTYFAEDLAREEAGLPSSRTGSARG